MSNNNQSVNIFCKQALCGLNSASLRIESIASSFDRHSDALFLKQLLENTSVVNNTNDHSKSAIEEAIEGLSSSYSSLASIAASLSDNDDATFLTQLLGDISIIAGTKNTLLGIDCDIAASEANFHEALIKNCNNIELVMSHVFYDQVLLAYAQGSFTLLDAVTTILQLVTEPNPETGEFDIEARLSSIEI